MSARVNSVSTPDRGATRPGRRGRNPMSRATTSTIVMLRSVWTRLPSTCPMSTGAGDRHRAEAVDDPLGHVHRDEIAVPWTAPAIGHEMILGVT